MKYILKNSILGTLITTIAITAYPIDVDAAATNGNTKKDKRLPRKLEFILNFTPLCLCAERFFV